MVFCTYICKPRYVCTYTWCYLCICIHSFKKWIVNEVIMKSDDDQGKPVKKTLSVGQYHALMRTKKSWCFKTVWLGNFGGQFFPIFSLYVRFNLLYCTSLSIFDIHCCSTYIGISATFRTCICIKLSFQPSGLRSHDHTAPWLNCLPNRIRVVVRGSMSAIMQELPLGQGCQMVRFQTKNPNLGKFWWVLQ
jgi:hypothetical protein